MKVVLAGYNVDTSVLSEIEGITGKRADLTPEVLSAAYARISRDPRPIDLIREEARQEVEKSRKSNSTIIFKMGHHSVAEHAVFNLDIMGVSRLAMEELEKFRLCSYTEKSQRYITLDKDHVVPDEIKKAGYADVFVRMIDEQNRGYFSLYEKLKEHVIRKYHDLAKDPKNDSLLDGWAKEDARYITALATESQVGQTINARNLELLLRRFASHPLSEINELGKAIYEKISGVAPSIVIFHNANDRDRNTYPELKERAGGILAALPKNTGRVTEDEVKLVECPSDGDIVTAASLLHSSTDLSYERCKEIAKSMSAEALMDLFKTAGRNMQFYDSMLREFEYVSLTFNVVLSAACFGQLKRHRMATITAQEYDPGLGVTVPESIKEIKMEEYFRGMTDKTEDVYNIIKKKVPLAAQYILTNAHRKRVLFKINARELYHISRLREDNHAQWDIRNVSRAMTCEARKKMPLTLALVGAKDRYNMIYESVYGDLPKVTEAILPGKRKIG